MSDGSYMDAYILFYLSLRAFCSGHCTYHLLSVIDTFFLLVIICMHGDGACLGVYITKIGFIYRIQKHSNNIAVTMSPFNHPHPHQTGI